VPGRAGLAAIACLFYAMLRHDSAALHFIESAWLGEPSPAVLVVVEEASGSRVCS
jgi:hypothetical protein